MFAYNDVHNPMVDKKMCLRDFSKIIEKRFSNIIININYLCILLNINKIDISNITIIKFGNIFKKRKVIYSLISYN